MNDDYDDPDEPGGLWDPEALSPPPAVRRPALHAVPAPDLAENEASSVETTEFAEDTLVRLDQFRPEAGADGGFDEERRWLGSRHWVQGIAALVVIAALGAGALTLGTGRDHPATPAAATFAGAEQAALNRTVTPQATDHHGSQANRRPGHSSQKARHSPKSSHGRHTVPTRRNAPTQPAATETASRQVSTTPPAPTATRTRSAAASTVAPASATNAEFGFEH